jgi:hypothetical protein
LWCAVQLAIHAFPFTPGRVGAFLLLTANPYLLEYFSLARGYGLSLGCLLAICLCMVRYLNTGQRKFYHLAIAASVVAIYANFTFINLFLALVASHNIMWMLKGKGLSWPGWMRLNLPYLVGSAVITVLIAKPLAVLIWKNELYYGGEHGFLQDTVQYLVLDFLYSKSYLGMSWEWPVFVVLGLLVVVSTFLVVANRVRGETPGELTFFWLLTGMLVIAVVSQFYLFDTRLPLHRTALVFYPLTSLLALYTLREAGKLVSGRIRGMLVVVPGILLCVHLMKTYTPHMYREWWFDSDTRKMLTYVEERHPGETVSLECHWLYMPAINYYKSLGYFPNIKAMYLLPEAEYRDRDYYYVYWDALQILEPRCERLKQFRDGFLLKGEVPESD